MNFRVQSDRSVHNIVPILSQFIYYKYKIPIYQLCRISGSIISAGTGSIMLNVYGKINADKVYIIQPCILRAIRNVLNLKSLLILRIYLNAWLFTYLFIIALLKNEVKYIFDRYLCCEFL